ncbi:MAG: (deoxy)nucleoside triphosphate pyrophosphohydrolase [Dermatophilaceae bacterium]
MTGDSASGRQPWEASGVGLGDSPSDPYAAAEPPRGWPRIDVVAALLVDSLVVPTRVLAAQRTEPPALAGGWEIPGGKVEPGESPEAAVRRELREELGVGLVLGMAVDGPIEGWWPLGARYRMRVWLAEVSDGLPAPLEDHEQLCWLGPEDVWSVNWLPANRPILEAALALLWPAGG